jgi:glutamine synthetase
VIRGVHKFGPLLRAVIASAANDHRLGANEAPPAILSVYLGDQLEKVFDDIKTGVLHVPSDGGEMDLGLSQILDFTRDAGDRNRTSPFAFTGNRFEFRAVGSSQSVSGPLVAMNTILADSLNWIADKLKAEQDAGAKTPAAVFAVLKEIMKEHGNAVFGGDGYSTDWHEMAVKERGLKNIPTTADALPVFKTPEVVELFASTGVLTRTELESRFEVYSEQYVLALEVEAKLTVEMATTIIYPAAVTYLSSLASVGAKLTPSPADAVTDAANAMMTAVGTLTTAIEKNDFATIEDHMNFLADEVRGLMDDVRAAADTLETLVSDSDWPLPKYREMLFIK